MFFFSIHDRLQDEVQKRSSVIAVQNQQEKETQYHAKTTPPENESATANEVIEDLDRTVDPPSLDAGETNQTVKPGCKIGVDNEQDTEGKTDKENKEQETNTTPVGVLVDVHVSNENSDDVAIENEEIDNVNIKEDENSVEVNTISGADVVNATDDSKIDSCNVTQIAAVSDTVQSLDDSLTSSGNENERDFDPGLSAVHENTNVDDPTTHSAIDSIENSNDVIGDEGETVENIIKYDGSHIHVTDFTKVGIDNEDSCKVDSNAPSDDLNNELNTDPVVSPEETIENDIEAVEQGKARDGKSQNEESLEQGHVELEKAEETAGTCSAEEENTAINQISDQPDDNTTDVLNQFSLDNSNKVDIQMC